MNDREIVLLSQPIKVDHLTVYPLSGYRWGIITTFELLPIKTSVQANSIAYVLTHEREEIARNINSLSEVSAEFTDTITADTYNKVLNILARNLAGLDNVQAGLGSKKKAGLMVRLLLIFRGLCMGAIVRRQKRSMNR